MVGKLEMSRFYIYKLLTWVTLLIRVIRKLPNSEQSYKGKVKTHNYINRQNQSTNGTLNKMSCPFVHFVVRYPGTKVNSINWFYLLRLIILVRIWCEWIREPINFTLGSKLNVIFLHLVKFVVELHINNYSLS